MVHPSLGILLAIHWTDRGIICMAMKRILIVDDESAFLCAVKKVMNGPEISVDTAETKDEAIDLMTKNTYAAVIADLRLTGSSGEEGLEIAQHVNENHPRTTMMLITAYGTSEVRQKAGEFGVEYYFEKPVSIDLLRNALQDLDWMNGSESDRK
jgi:CheY-like chemotaxis protein